MLSRFIIFEAGMESTVILFASSGSNPTSTNYFFYRALDPCSFWMRAIGLSSNRVVPMLKPSLYWFWLIYFCRVSSTTEDAPIFTISNAEWLRFSSSVDGVFFVCVLGSRRKLRAGISWAWRIFSTLRWAPLSVHAKACALRRGIAWS